MISEPELFDKLLPCMGPFHWERILLKCQGRLLRGSGIDDALVECEVFGKGVLESVLNGTHYYRSFAGMLIVEDIILSLMWRAFWESHDKKYYLCIPIAIYQNMF